MKVGAPLSDQPPRDKRVRIRPAGKSERAHDEEPYSGGCDRQSLNSTPYLSAADRAGATAKGQISKSAPRSATSRQGTKEYESARRKIRASTRRRALFGRLRPPVAELDPIPERGRPRRRHRQALNMKVGAPLGGQPPRDKRVQIRPAGKSERAHDEEPYSGGCDRRSLNSTPYLSAADRAGAAAKR